MTSLERSTPSVLLCRNLSLLRTSSVFPLFHCLLRNNLELIFGDRSSWHPVRDSDFACDGAVANSSMKFDPRQRAPADIDAGLPYDEQFSV
ncbi:hypothetical protein QYR01_01335 [Brucella anthropi]|uniref:hypothetical protein n=1 Tax=Brucella anthropi TaxID=529 RepID=UPI0026721A01|nr:hypothetical protein [Brucella anthropi]WKT92409.1 hypothetical protein QYR01_01335 [Brucella anthropi]